jgi:hypothetical protein
MKLLAYATVVAACLLSGCVPMMPPAAPGGGAPGTSPEVCANIRARIAQSPDAQTRAYAEDQASAIGC